MQRRGVGLVRGCKCRHGAGGTRLSKSIHATGLLNLHTDMLRRSVIEKGQSLYSNDLLSRRFSTPISSRTPARTSSRERHANTQCPKSAGTIWPLLMLNVTSSPCTLEAQFLFRIKGLSRTRTFKRGSVDAKTNVKDYCSAAFHIHRAWLARSRAFNSYKISTYSFHQYRIIRKNEMLSRAISALPRCQNIKVLFMWCTYCRLSSHLS
jgi:hypothetical protein